VGAGTCDPQHPLDAMGRLESFPIVPPRLFGAVDPSGGAWSGLSLEDMERAFCQSDPISEDEETVTAGWGSAPDFAVTVEYNKATHQIDFFQLNAGYMGTLEFASRPSALGDPTKPNPSGQHRYSIGVGRPILRDGQPWELDWKNIDVQATEMFDALMFTYAAELPSTQTSCRAQGSCLARAIDGSQGVFGVRPLGIYLYVPNVTAPQPAASTPGYMYGYPVKMTPFSIADALLKLDAEGPTATARDVGERHSQCVMKLGMTFSSFLADCVDVLSSPEQNALLDKKILGAATRSVSPTGTPALVATWVLDVTGFHPDFASERFDEQAPPATAKASGLVLDDRSSGKILNDYSPDGSTLTLDGTAAVYREYARLVQSFLHDQMDKELPRFGLGDTHCLLPAGGNAATWRPASGCTGMEQIAIPADPSTAKDPGIQRISIGIQNAASFGLGSALRPGVVSALFCSDPDALEHCSEPSAGIFGDTRAQVIAVLGGGDVSTLPEAVRDRKLYVRLWAKALAKYFLAAAAGPVDLGDAKFDSVTPADGDVTIDSIRGDLLSVKYKNRLELRVNYLSGVGSQLIFH
jgi:hypothetical protein